MESKTNNVFSPNQVAKSLGVSEASIKRWCDKGILHFTKTAGGHRRIPLYEVLDFVRDNDFALAQPEILGLPAAVGSGTRTLDQARQNYAQALERGDESWCLQIVFDLRLAGHDIAVIGDRVISPAFQQLGKRWEHGEAAIYQERRGVEITRHVLSRFKDTLGTTRPIAAKAIGATLPGDPYTLAGQLCELVLLELGWQARFLGSELPVETLVQAVEDLQPQVLWLSFSNLDNPKELVGEYGQLYQSCLKRQCAVAIGGRALTSSIRKQLQYAFYGDNLTHFRAFLQTLSAFK